MKPTFLRFDVPWLGEVTFPAYMTMLLVGFKLIIGRGTSESFKT